MILQNDRVFAEIADNTGAIVRLKDKQSGMDYITALPETAARVSFKQSFTRMDGTSLKQDFFLSPVKAAVTAADGGAAIDFTFEYGIVLHAKVTPAEDGLAFTSRTECGSETELCRVEYPVIGGMGDYGGETELIHSFATGLRVKNPIANFKDGEGVRNAPYPECFSGASMQCYAYLAPGKGGLLFTAEDGESHQKWLNLYKNKDAMEGTMMYGFEDMGPGKAFCAPYPFTVRFLEGKGWWEAAEKYKQWAVNQPWCAMGTLRERRHCEWLLRDIGLSTFGIDASQDRSLYIDHYHNDVHTNVFHILGPDWAKAGGTFGGGLKHDVNPGSNYNDWFPTRFNQETLKSIRDAGDRFAPFEFDLFGHALEGDTDENKQKAENNRQAFPQPPRAYSCDAYNFYMMCPTEDLTQTLHRERDAQVVRECDADGMYYDISANNLLHICMKENHKHKKGGGNELTRAYSKLYKDTKEACASVKNEEYFPVGTEMINEVFLPVLDFYQARAGARPCSSLELWPYQELVNKGIAELIPMFPYVYHEYGAVRLDGWGKCVEEVGDLFYDSVAKIYEWGGLYELNHEYSPGEAFDGKETLVEDHYWGGFGRFGYEYSYSRARYIRKFADLRTGLGNKYLAYGAMMPLPDAAIPERNKHFYHYNHGVKEIFEGDIMLPAVRMAAWKSVCEDKETYAVIMTNTGLMEEHLTLRLSKADYPAGTKAVLHTGFGTDEKNCVPLGELTDEGLTVSLGLPSREPVMLEII